MAPPQPYQWRQLPLCPPASILVQLLSRITTAGPELALPEAAAEGAADIIEPDGAGPEAEGPTAEAEAGGAPELEAGSAPEIEVVGTTELAVPGGAELKGSREVPTRPPAVVDEVGKTEVESAGGTSVSSGKSAATWLIKTSKRDQPIADAERPKRMLSSTGFLAR